MMARFISNYVKREKRIGGSLIALFDLASESPGVTSIRSDLLRQAEFSPRFKGRENRLCLLMGCGKRMLDWEHCYDHF